MIKAQHNSAARMIFNPYLKYLLKKNFSGIYLCNEFPDIKTGTGLIITPNHFSWWDGFFIDYVSRRCINRKIHILMLEEQLKRYWFFRFLGAYSINENKPKSVAETAEYTASVLKDTSNFVVYYPQGRIEPYDKKPLDLKEGLIYFLKKIQISTLVVPAAFKIVFGKEKYPLITVRFGMPVEDSKVISCFDEFKRLFNENLVHLDEEILHNKQLIKI